MSAAVSPDELADLRRRAYAPGAALDDGDLDRLQRLEDARRDAAADPDAETAADADAEPEAEADVDPEPVVVSAPEPVRATVRRRPVLLALAVVAVTAAVIAALWLVTRPEAATVLRRVAVNDTAVQQPLASSLRTYGLDPDSFVQFESFEQLSLWSARIPDRGLRCLIVVDDQAAGVTYNGVVGWSCTPDGIPPSVDIVQGRGADEAVLADRPAGSVARFVLLADRIELTLALARADEEDG